jgi:hypothetical protein
LIPRALGALVKFFKVDSEVHELDSSTIYPIAAKDARHVLADSQIDVKSSVQPSMYQSVGLSEAAHGRDDARDSRKPSCWKPVVAPNSWRIVQMHEVNTEMT